MFQRHAEGSTRPEIKLCSHSLREDSNRVPGNRRANRRVAAGPRQLVASRLACLPARS